ncbi:MAG: GntR family transcriptional regulator [Betaproteobacteria bacterium]|jgi:GntR family transcriptional regulator|nr:GntR family transcriptional regulator [Betaproteobacteria bacterium]MBT6529659.1 GntR family transcriptional regulator [Betaproteobacteria bacterium]
MNPLYLQVKKRITESLAEGLWNPGQSIPSEVELAQSFSVSQGTVRKAIDELAAENILIRRQGKGTFVASHDEEGSQLRFLRLTSTQNNKENLDNHLVSFTKEKATNKIAKSLGVNIGTTVVSIKRVLTFNQKPLILDFIKVPASSFRKLTSEMIVEKKGAMYRMYETEFGIQMLRAQEKIRAVAADADTSELLGVKKNTPVLSVERISLTYSDKPIEWRLGLCLTENHHYASELD